MHLQRLLRPPSAAIYLGLAPSTLEKLRAVSDGPPFIRIGRRAIAYDVQDLDRWLEARKQAGFIGSNGDVA
jgi:predicted DNA-binding transcriptional regulator AlpA